MFNTFDFSVLILLFILITIAALFGFFADSDSEKCRRM